MSEEHRPRMCPAIVEWAVQAFNLQGARSDSSVWLDAKTGVRDRLDHVVRHGSRELAVGDDILSLGEFLPKLIDLVPIDMG